jgi:hypothetical protein
MTDQGVGVKDVQACMARVNPTGPLRSSAIRTLKTLQEKDPSVTLNSENIKLVTALRDLKVGYVNLSVFKEWKSQVCVTEKVEQKFFILAKDKRPRLDQEPEFQGFGDDSWLVDPETLDASVEKDLYWFIDIACAKLPKGAMSWHASIANVQKSAGGGIPGGAPSITLPNQGRGSGSRVGPDDARQSTKEAEPPKEAEEAEPPQKGDAPKSSALRELRERPSDSNVTDEEFTDHLISRADKCFKEECFYDKDPNQVTAHSVLVRYRLYLKSCAEQRQDVPSEMVDFFKWFIKALLTRPSYPWIQPFVEEIILIQKIQPSNVPAGGMALLRVKASSLTSLAKVDLSFLDHKQDFFFTNCQFYKSYLAERRAAMYDLVLKVSTPKAEKLELVECLLPGAGEGDQKKQMMFVKTIAGTLPDLAKCQYLLRAADGIATLQKLFPEDSKKCLRFVTSGAKTKGATYDELVECVELVLSFGDALINDLANPVTRAYIVCYGKVKAACASANAVSIAKTLPDNLMKELAACKLGVEVQGVEPVPPLQPDAQELASSVVKILEATLRKLPNDDSSPWLAALIRVAVKEEEAEPPATPTAVAAVDASPVPPEKESVKKPSLGSGVSEPEVGDVMIAHVEKEGPAKINFHGQEAEVVEVLSKALRLRMLGGPQLGTMQKFDKSKCTSKRPAGEAEGASPGKVAKVQSVAAASAAKVFGNLDGI